MRIVWSFSMNRASAVSMGRTTRRDCQVPKHGIETGITDRRCPDFGCRCRCGTTSFGREYIIIIITIFVVVVIIMAGWHCCLILKAPGINLFESFEGR